MYNRSVVHVNPHFDQHIATSLFKRYYYPPMDYEDIELPRKRFVYTGVGYIMSSAAARAMLDIIKPHGFCVAADITRTKLLDTIEGCYTTAPLLVSIPKPVSDKLIADDTDIQRSEDKLPGVPKIWRPLSADGKAPN